MSPLDWYAASYFAADRIRAAGAAAGTSTRRLQPDRDAVGVHRHGRSAHRRRTKGVEVRTE